MAPSFPYTANYFSKEDEERERQELSDTEKKTILCDMYGRRKAVPINDFDGNHNNHNSCDRNGNVNQNFRDDDNSDDTTNPNYNNDDDDDDSSSDSTTTISSEMLRQFYEAIEQIPPEKNCWLLRALSENEDVVDMESCPSFFLRYANYDPKKAAVHLCNYWKVRVEIFGEEHAFRFMTLRGAMEDVIPYLVRMPNFFRILPNDDQGRVVVCGDKTGLSYKEYDDDVFLKIGWFVFHMALQRRSAQENGIVFIWINQSSRWDFPSMNLLKLALRMISYNGIPIKICCRHNCVSSLISTCMVPIGKLLMSRDLRLRLQTHNSISKHKTLKDLENFGLHCDNLPKSIGGSYDKRPTWIDECERILIESNEQSLHTNKRPRN